MREMLKRLCAATALSAAMVISTGAMADDGFKLTVLHINDVHSRILPINKYDSTCGEKRMTAGECFGGMARLGQAIQDRRAALEADGHHVVTLDAGDQFQGSLFYTTYKGGAAVEIMNRIGFDAMVVGNHEFDDGPKKLLEFIDKAQFPVISGNVDVTADVGLKGRLPAVQMVSKGDHKIAIIGVTAEDTDETSSPGDTIAFRDTISYLPGIIAQLEADGVNKIILLSHLGLPRDQEVAKAVSGLDLIVGGHSHTLLSNSQDRASGPYPMRVTDPSGNEVPIVQAYAYSKFLGEIELTFDADGNVTSAEGDTVLITQAMPENTEIAALITELNGPLEEIKTRVVGESTVLVDADRANCRAKECLMGNLVSDAIMWKTVQMGAPVDAVIQNGGGLRASIDAGPVTMGEVLTVLPFQNTLATFELTGAGILTALENGLSRIEDGAGRFPQVAGISYVFDAKAEPGKRVVSVEVSGAPLDPAKVYKLASNNYMRGGGDGYDVFETDGMNAYDYGPGLEDVLAEYITTNGPIAPVLDGRIKQK